MTIDTAWRPAPHTLILAPDTVHVWRFSLAAPDATHEQWLDDNERERAARFHRESDRARFVAAHARLRHTLARYMNADPAALVFTRGAHGKPYLTEHPLQFNLSHSNDLALVAVARTRAVGVDVETVRAEVAQEAVAERYFSEGEVRVLRSLPPAEQAGAFFACWTRKEAYVKGRGMGFALPLASFDVSLRPGEPARLLAVRGDTAGSAQWSLAALSVGAGYAAALAVEGEMSRIVCYDWA